MNALTELTELADKAKRQEVSLREILLFKKALKWREHCRETSEELPTQLEGYYLLSLLCDYKCKELLPPLPEAVVEEEEEEASIVNLEKIYQNLFEAKEFLYQKQQQMEPIYTRNGALILDREVYYPTELLRPVSFAELFSRLTEVLEKEQHPTSLSLPEPFPSLEEQIEKIWERLKTTQEGVSFLALLGNHHRRTVIVSFLAILELIRKRKVRAYQKEVGEEIFLYPVPEAA